MKTIALFEFFVSAALVVASGYFTSLSLERSQTTREHFIRQDIAARLNHHVAPRVNDILKQVQELAHQDSNMSSCGVFCPESSARLLEQLTGKLRALISVQEESSFSCNTQCKQAVRQYLEGLSTSLLANLTHDVGAKQRLLRQELAHYREAENEEEFADITLGISRKRSEKKEIPNILEEGDLVAIYSPTTVETILHSILDQLKATDISNEFFQRAAKVLARDEN